MGQFRRLLLVVKHTPYEMYLQVRVGTFGSLGSTGVGRGGSRGSLSRRINEARGGA